MPEDIQLKLVILSLCKKIETDNSHSKYFFLNAVNIFLIDHLSSTDRLYIWHTILLSVYHAWQICTGSLPGQRVVATLGKWDVEPYSMRWRGRSSGLGLIL